MTITVRITQFVMESIWCSRLMTVLPEITKVFLTIIREWTNVIL